MIIAQSSTGAFAISYTTFVKKSSYNIIFKEIYLENDIVKLLNS
jgi:hypothetical protein